MFSTPLILASATIDVDATALIMAALFFLLFFLLRPLMKSYLAVVDAREEAIAGRREEAEDMTFRAESTLSEFEEKIQRARLEAQDVRETLRNQGLQDQRDRVNEARAELGAKLKDERAKIQKEVDEAQVELAQRAEQISQVMVDKILPSF